MRQSVKRSVTEAVTRAVLAAGAVKFVRQTQGYWVCSTGPKVSWELEILHEPEHGDGMFRLGWGVRVDGASEILGIDDLQGTNGATISGDLGSLAEGRKRWTMLSISTGTAGSLSRLWWGTRAKTPDELTALVSVWIRKVAPAFLGLRSPGDVADFIDNFNNIFRKADIELGGSADRMITKVVALRALDTDRVAAEAALRRWEQMLSGQQKRAEFLRKLDDAFLRRVRLAISRL